MERNLSLRVYVVQKVMLLEESNIRDEELVQRVWEGLDPVLMATICPELLTQYEFTERLYLQEVPGRLL